MQTQLQTFILILKISGMPKLWQVLLHLKLNTTLHDFCFCTIDLDTQYHVLLKSTTAKCCNCPYGKHTQCINKTFNSTTNLLHKYSWTFKFYQNCTNWVPSIIQTNTETLRYMWYDIYYRQLHQHTLWALWWWWSGCSTEIKPFMHTLISY